MCSIQLFSELRSFLQSVITFFVCVFFCPVSIAQNLTFKYLTINEGLSQNTVNSIVQDRRGVIWIGTLDGLNKFDGYQFSTYNHNTRDKTSLSHNRINTLFNDRSGNLWVGTYDGLNLFDKKTETFRVFRNPNGGLYIVYSVQEDRNGNIWIGSSQGVKFLNVKSGWLSNVDLHIPSSPEFLTVQHLFIDREQRLWVGMRGGLRLVDLNTRKLLPLPEVLSRHLSGAWIRAIKQAENGDLWFATEANGLTHYELKTKKITHYTTGSGLLNNAVRDLLFVGADQIWIATLTGLNILDLNTGRISGYTYSPDFESGKSLNHASVRCLLKDKSQNIWLGTFSGGINLACNYKENFSHKGQLSGDKNKLSGKEVTSIFEDGPHSVWLATDAGGLNHWNRLTGQVKVYRHKQASSHSFISVKKIEEHQDPDKLWLSTDRGIFVFSKSAGTFREFSGIKNVKTSSSHQNYCFEKTGQGLWVGTDFNGLYFLDKQGKIRSWSKTKDGPASIASNFISCLEADGNKGLWIGHQSSGLNYMDFATGKIIRYLFDFGDPRSLSSNHISCLLIDSRKQLWVGTDGGGLNYFDRKTGNFFCLNKEDGLSNHTIQSIEEDNKGRIWVSTNKGLFQISLRKNAPSFQKSNLKITNYTAKDGLQSDQFIKGSSFKSKSGELFFGGINGLSSFFPEKISINKIKPDLIFTDLLILNKPVKPSPGSFLKQALDFTKEIELRYDQAYLTIRFAALNYIYPENNKYAYKLEGFADSSWNFVGNQRSATYTNLDPGEYLFKVKASNNSNIWNEQPRELKIIVLPPWWRTWWAYLIYAGIILSLLYLFSYYAKYTERLKNTIEQEAYLYRKEQELAQKKLSFFINISHEIKTPITMILTPLQRLMGLSDISPKMYNYLNLMNRSGQRLLTLIDQLLDLRKFDNETASLKAAEGNLVRFTKEIVIVFSELAKSKKIDLTFHAEQSELLLWFDRDKLEKILYNLISNAIKYTPSYGKVEVKVGSENSEWAIISVNDNGCGIFPGQLAHLFEPFHHYDSMQNNVQGSGIGLAFTKELVEQHRGEIEVDSSPADEGQTGYTHIKVKIPLTSDYLTHADLDEQYLRTEDISSYKNFNLNKRTQLQTKKKSIKKLNENKPFLMLIVEDNEDVLNFLAESFQDDFEVVKSLNGRDGYEKALELIPDVIISDVMMPEMNGIELCSSLKTDIRTNHIPLILLTARSPLIFKIEGLENGADEYVTKPFNFDLLELKVWNLLDSRQKMRLRYQKEVLLQPTNTIISSFDDKFLEKVIKYIEDHISEEQLSVEEISSEVGMTRGNLYKKLKSLTNQSPVEFIRYIRIKRAAQLLSQHRIYVNEVCFMVGFQDVNYFRKCFKEQFGVTPSEFSKEVNSV